MRRAVAGAAAAVLVTTLAVAGWRTWHGDGDPTAATQECTAVVDGHAVTLDPEQARWAGLIVAISVERGLPARAASIGLATAYQESKLYNLRYGDRDSIGLFQQRPSQGWGTRDELLDPAYAANAFYDALERVAGYQSLRITEAAQEVQRSGYPSAYAVHETDARALASALTGHSAHAFACRLEAPRRPGSARSIGRDVATTFPGQPAQTSSGVLAVTAGDPTRGWAIAQYLVSQAHRLRLTWVSYDGRTWRAGDHSGAGWRADATTAGTAETAGGTLHVRVGVDA